MAKKPTLKDVSSGFLSAATINENNDAVEAAFENTLSRDGSTPNSMGADLDMNSNDIINAKTIYSQGLNIAGNPIAVDETLVATNPISNFATKTVLEAATVDSSLSAVYLQGHTTIGDGGNGLYKKVVSEPDHDLKIQDAAGTWFEFTPTNGVVTEKHAGGVGDGVNDDTSAIQSAIDFVIYNSNNSSSSIPCRVLLIGPKLKTSDTIHVGYGEDFHSCHIMGTGKKRRNEDKMFGTAIVPTFTDRPVINVQGARTVILENFWIEGAATGYTSIAMTGANGFASESTWDAVVSDSRYAPYAGITIDAYSGTAPGSAYPNVTFPSRLSGIVSTQYGKSSSGAVTVRGVGIRQCTVGVAFVPSDSDANGDFCDVIDCEIERCKWAISIGNSQARNFNISDNFFASVYCHITNDTHGKQLGKVSGSVSNNSFSTCALILQFNSVSILGRAEWDGNYGEENYKLIKQTATASSNEEDLVWENSEFSFSHDDDRGVPSQLIETPTSVVTTGYVFRDCRLRNFKSVFDAGCQYLTLINTRLIPADRSSGTVSSYIAQAHNGLGGGLTYRWSQTQPVRQQHIHYDLFSISAGTITTDGQTTAPERHYLTSRNYCIPYYALKARHQNDFGEEAVSYRRPPVTFENRSNFTSITLSNKTLTLVKASITDAEAMVDGMEPGDVIRDPESGMVFFIRSRVGTTITAEAQNNFITNGGGGYNTLDTFSTSTSTGQLTFLNTRIFFAGNEGWVVFDTGTSPSAYRRGDNDGTFLDNATTGVVDQDTDGTRGDYMYFSPTLEAFHLNSEMEIQTIDNSAKTILFVGTNPRHSIDRFNMRAFIRKPVANV